MSQTTTEPTPGPGPREGTMFGEPMTPGMLANPHPIYHRIRAEQPVFYNEEEDFYIFTRYADCEAVLRDHRWSTNPVHRITTVPLPEAFNPRDEMASGSAHV